jgi:GNAT superfamily N-acetyltransferase
VSTEQSDQFMFVDQSVARLLEHAESAACLAFCEAAQRMYPLGGIRALRDAGGRGGASLFYGPSDPLNAVKGPGLSGPVEPSDWEAVEEVYRPSGSPVVVDVCPLADEGFVAMLMERGYRIGSFETVMTRRLGQGREPPSRPRVSGLEIRGVEQAEARAWSRVLDAGFADGGEPMRFAVDIGAVRSAMSSSIMLLATIEGTPAGGAGMSLHGDVALMSGAAVLPAFRGHGIQQALTARRLEIALERGARLAKLDVRAGSGSYRNAVRAGFEVAYTRPQLVRDWHAV